MPSLLTLPLELRHEVYAYLHRPFSCVWLVDGNYVHCAEVEVAEAPLPEVSLVCAQLHAEYITSEVHRKLMMTIRIWGDKIDCDMVDESDPQDAHAGSISHAEWALGSMGEVRMHTSTASTLQISPLLEHLKHILVLIRGERKYDDTDGDSATNDTLQDVAQVLGGHVPRLKTIKIAAQFFEDEVTIHDWRAKQKVADHIGNTTWVSMVTHPSLLNLRLVQVCAFGLSRDLAATEPTTSTQPSDPRPRYTWVVYVPGRALLYAADQNLARPSFWVPEQMREVLSEDEIPGANGCTWTRVETSNWPFLTKPEKVSRWLERRGDDLDT
ncbi:hypothetical protein FB567DRAFT_539274 [Paraphoma chrysanthemicola]|uniref:Uncharacterized protein n=1 Tax=Paraphoma chrysanthemicola TaxID=798071 RepID=A0A8K0QUH4_9PLEO|nr:hypothetical protein FB567DRAFT_539274 [Paraphoma chrysanthemicola]